MPSEATLCSHPVIKSSLAKILEINRDEFDHRCRLCVMGLGGGSGFSCTYKLLVKDSGAAGLKERKEGVEWVFFMKVVEGEGMARGEFYSLKAIHLSIPILCPLPYCYGQLSTDTGGASAPCAQVTLYTDEPGMPPLLPSCSGTPPDDTARGGAWFLLTDFIHHTRSSSHCNPHQTLAYKLAKLHSTPAPYHEEDKLNTPGFPFTTMCGSTPQPNNPVVAGDVGNTWAKFFTERRIRAVAEKCQRGTWSALVEKICVEVVPKLIGVYGWKMDVHTGEGSHGEEGEEQMVVCHGDLWNGNFMFGRIERVWGTQNVVETSDGEVKGQGVIDGYPRVHREILIGDFIFDPAAAYAPATYDHGIMHMFGGFSNSFWSNYWTYRKEFSSETPRLPWDVLNKPGLGHPRIKLYELYHYLNHNVLFGGSYGSSAERIMRDLVVSLGDAQGHMNT